ncbi:MAG: NUDIX hydrolase [Verrucomicrobiota bacterium JB022]|nr:NUDIX hydrolase [Verrucomicrobiota bacterium JB022]
MSADIMKTARELQAMAQTGLHFAHDPYDRARYERLREIAAGLMAKVSNQTITTILRWQEAEFGYATPKVDTRAFIVQDGRILLIREDADEGRWTLPGGWADVNDTPSEAVCREVWEETGYTCRTTRLLALWDREKHGHTPSFPFHVYKLFFHCEITGGEARPTAESSEQAWFAPDALPDLSVTRVQATQLRRLFEKVTGRDTTTDFD